MDDDIDVVDSLLEVAGGRVFVRRWLADWSGRPPIVLLHDSLGSVELWRDFPAALARSTGREIIAYDRLGFGRSSRRAGRTAVDFISEEAEKFFPAIRHSLGLARFSLFGHSVGGAMALVVAALQDDACEAVITESAQAFVEPRTLSGIGKAKAKFEDPDQLAKLARWHGEKARWVLDAWTEVWLSPSFSAWTLDPWLGDVRCPVMAIHGDLDEYGSVAFPHSIVSKAGGPSTLAILAGCGHVPHRERQDEVLRLASSFLARCQGR